MNRPSQLPSLIRQMLDPSFYPHPVREPILLQQTHISYVLLTGPYAYKVKKPICLPFLDFSTTTLRGKNLRLELERNKGFSPDLYLEVLPISRNDKGIYRFGAGNVSDYALKMNEFPQEALWSHRFENGCLTQSMVTALGRKVALMHASALTGPEITAYGDPSVVEGVIEGNYKETEQFVGTLQDPAQLEQTRLFTRHLLNRRADLLIERQQGGFIRACHGDLHLNNVITWRGQAQVFDCIEFNEEFSNIDTLYDAAFILVDLEHRNRTDLAWQFMNTYLEYTGDYRGAVLLPLYASMRAYVRAKIYSFQTVDSERSPEEQRKAAIKAEAFYKLACWFTRARHRGLWAVGGLSGSGKSTVSAWLAQRLGAVHVRSDAVRKHLCGMPLDQRGSDAVYTTAMNKRTYDTLAETGFYLASQGIPVILDAKYDRRSERGKLRDLAAQYGLPVHFIQCEAPEALLRYRLSHRKGDVSDATADLISRQVMQAEAPGPDEEIFALDTSRDWRRQLAENLHSGPLLCA
ncbi:MAG: AAA family ATPase [Acidobacteriota bacterium]|nr:AAA family ATPase [Acidobacteriota bacterium]